LYYDSARVQLESRQRANPDDERMYSALGIAYAGLGRKEDAVRSGLRGTEMLPVEKEAWRGSFRLIDLAQIYTMTGDHEKAIDVLERLLSIPSEMSSIWLKIDPAWNPLRSNKRFQQLVAGTL
jgi:Flp pilus assembly protein TadD